MNGQKSDRIWYAIYTKPRWEKKVHELMGRRGVESYCPLNKVQKKWSDRLKIIEEPLFKSYVFVKLSDAERSEVRYIDGVVNYVYWLGKPAQIKDEEIEKIKRFLNEYQDVKVEHMAPLKSGDTVMVTSGIFIDHEARVLETLHKKVVLEIAGLGCRLVATVGIQHVEKK
jgi:transcription antitermination factor NusG